MSFLKDLQCRYENQVIPLQLRETTLVSINAPMINLKIKDIHQILYGLAIENLMYTRDSTHPDIVFFVGMLGRYLIYLRWKFGK